MAVHQPRPCGSGLTGQTGGCLCGKIRFEVVGEPRSAMYCHCFFCRRQTGAPVAAFVDCDGVAEFRWVRGRPGAYRSSPGVRRSFCRSCGTPLTFEAEHYPGRIYVAIGTFDDPDCFPPASHAHVDHRIAWFDTADTLPRYRGGSLERVGD